jgi:hypothetical protein
MTINNNPLPEDVPPKPIELDFMDRYAPPLDITPIGWKALVMWIESYEKWYRKNWESK